MSSDPTTDLPQPVDEWNDRQIDEAQSTLSRLLEWIRAVDTKTPVVMAIDTGMLGVLAAMAPLPKDLALPAALWLALGVVPLVGSLGLCALATFPQTQGPAGSLVYFGGIATRSAPQYIQAVRKRTRPEYLEDLLTQCHRNAEIAATKYDYVRRALFWLVGAIPFWLAAIYVVSRAR